VADSHLASWGEVAEVSDARQWVGDNERRVLSRLARGVTSSEGPQLMPPLGSDRYRRRYPARLHSRTQRAERPVDSTQLKEGRMATITVSGKLTDDPLLRFTTTGQAVATFFVAESRRWQDPDSQTWKELVSYFEVVAWGSLGRKAAESLSKGARVIVIGHIDNNSETTEGDGRLKLEVTATEIAVSL
jgi:hypothetical protein